MLSRGETKRLLRRATQVRIREERETLDAVKHLYRGAAGGRLEETLNLHLLKSIDSVFATAERLNPKYQRPLWASQRYGAR